MSDRKTYYEMMIPCNAAVAVEALLIERDFQDDKHGNLLRSPHSVAEWIMLIEAELAEAKEACIKGGKGRDSIMSEIVQIGALALAAIEQHGIEEIDKRSV